ncbi:MAG: NTE family protein [Lysobacterales bacterium]|jgi:NTE family protein
MVLSSFVNKFNIVRQIPCFTSLNWFDLQKVARKVRIEEYKKGMYVSREGTPPDFFFCLVTGRLQAFTRSEDAKTNVDFIHRGQHFGIVSVLTGENHSMNYETLNDSVVLKIDKDDFRAILKSIPHLGVEFSHTLSKRIRRNVKGQKTIFESKIISVYSPVEGTGCSTYAINLALSLQKETKKKVIFVNIAPSTKERLDPDSPENATSPCWKAEAVDLNTIVGNLEKIISTVIKGDLDVDLLNIVFNPDDSDAKENISPFVTTLVGDYHYVVVGLPNKMDDVVFETLAQSDLLHLVTLDRKADLILTRNVIDGLQDKLKENFREERIKVVLRLNRAKMYLTYEDINKILDYDVYKALPYVQRSELIEDLKCQSFVLHICERKGEYAKVVRRISREIGGVLVGVVLGGGAALGIAHIGVIRKLEENNIPVDVVVGSSMGALIGAMWAVGNDVDALEKMAREFEKKTNMLKLFDPVIPISGLIGGRLIKRWLRKYLGSKTFYETKIPFKVVAYDLNRREELVLNSGSLVDAVRQSIAIPGVIEPIKKGEQVIIDGGVLNPLPTNVCTGLGIKKIIAVNVLQSPEDVSKGVDIENHKMLEKAKIPFYKNPFQWLGFRIGRFLAKTLTPNISDIIVQTLQASEYVIAEQSGNHADVLIHPDLVGVNWYELHRVDELIKAGEDATSDVMDKIKDLVDQ